MSWKSLRCLAIAVLAAASLSSTLPAAARPLPQPSPVGPELKAPRPAANPGLFDLFLNLLKRIWTEEGSSMDPNG